MIKLSRQWKDQPGFAVGPDPSLDIVRLINGGIGVGTSAEFDVAKNTAVPWGLSAEMGYGLYGSGWEFNATATHYMEFKAHDCADRFTVFAVTSVTNIFAVRSMLNSDNNSGAGRVFQFRVATTGNLEFVRFNTAQASLNVSCATPATRDKGIAVVGTTNGTTVNVYAAGASGTGTITGTPAPLTTQVVRVGQTLVAGNFLVGTMFLAGLANRAWTPEEAKAFIDDPYSVFLPKQQAIYFDVAAVGGFKAAWVQNNVVL